MEVMNKSIEVKSMRDVDFSHLKMPQIVIYYHPDDFPESCIARVFDSGIPTNVFMRRNSVEELQLDISRLQNMIFFWRCPEDELQIMGVWM